ncbi:hypothetical protein E4T56_gene4228, partial [Termitomyces sp. T112]
MNQVDLVIGNSSSVLLDAPSFGVPTVAIGDRQKGRERAASVFHAAPERAAIAAAIGHALQRGRRETINPYGDGHASRRFADIIAAIPDFKMLLKKAGVNHDGSLDKAVALVDAAAQAGADIVKFQTFSAKALAGLSAKKADYQQRTTDAGEGQLAMLERLELPHTAHHILIERARERG